MLLADLDLGPDQIWTKRPIDQVALRSLVSGGQSHPISLKARRVRIILAGMSNMLANIVAAALAPDIVVVGSAGEDDDVAAEVCATRAEALVTQALQPENGELYRPLLIGFPTLKVIAIAGDGGSG